MHIADVKLSNTWTPLSDFIEVEADATYTLVNSSPDTMYMVESDSAPQEDIVGVIVVPEDYVVYKKGAQANLFMRNGGVPVTMQGAPQVKYSNLTINKVG